MDRFFSILATCPLFFNIGEEDFAALLSCLNAKTRHYERGEMVFRAEDPATHVGIVAAGAVDVVQEDFWGNRVILTRLTQGDLFGEAFSCAGVEKLPVSVMAVEDTAILLVDYRRTITTCSNACAFHTRLIFNMLRILASKNIALTRKIEFVTRRTTREKLLAYLSAQANEARRGEFTIPFDRQALAEYLAVDRSAMSAELSRMQREGLLTYEKNRFALKAPRDSS